MVNTKKILREIYKNKRSKLSFSEVEDLSKEIFKKIKKLNIWSKSNYHIYLSNQFKKEVDTQKIINFLFSVNKNVIVPKVKKSSLLHIKIDKDSSFKLNSLEFKEPITLNKIDHSTIEIIIVPLLCCDKRGHRVGYGGGYYDKFLVDVTAIKIGLSLFEPVEKIDDIMDHDISLDYVITPKKIYDFGVT